MANLKIKTFNNFHDVQNVVEDGRKVTTEIQLEGSPVKAVAAKNDPKVCFKSPKMVAKKLARMIYTKTADIGLLRRFLLSLSDDLPDLVSKLLTDSEVSQVYNIVNSVTVKHELDNAFDPEPPDEGVDPGVASDEVGGGEGGEGGIGELVISHIESCKEPIDIKEEISISQPSSVNGVNGLPANRPRRRSTEQPSTSVRSTEQPFTNVRSTEQSMSVRSTEHSSTSVPSSVIVRRITAPKTQTIPDKQDEVCVLLEKVVQPTRNREPRQTSRSMDPDRLLDRYHNGLSNGGGVVLQPLSGGAELIDLSGVQPGQRVQAAHNNTQSSVQDMFTNPWGLPPDFATYEAALRDAIRISVTNSEAHKNLSEAYDGMLRDYATHSEANYNHIMERYSIILGGNTSSFQQKFSRPRSMRSQAESNKIKPDLNINQTRTELIRAGHLGPSVAVIKSTYGVQSRETTKRSCDDILDSSRPVQIKRTRVDLKNVMNNPMVTINQVNLLPGGSCKAEIGEKKTMRKRTQPTRAAAKKAMKRTKTAVVESSSSSSSPSSSESEHSELDRVNSDIDRVKEQIMTKRMKLTKQRNKQMRHRSPVDRDLTSSEEGEEEEEETSQPAKKQNNSRKKKIATDRDEKRNLRDRFIHENLEYSSDDESHEAQRHRALEKLKERRGTTTKKSLISSRPEDSDTDEEKNDEDLSKQKKSKRNLFHQERENRSANHEIQNGDIQELVDNDIPKGADNDIHKEVDSDIHEVVDSDIHKVGSNDIQKEVGDNDLHDVLDNDIQKGVDNDLQEELVNNINGDSDSESGFSFLKAPTKGRKIVSDSEGELVEEDSDTPGDQGDDTDDSFVDKDDEEDDNFMEEFVGIKESLMRRNERFLELNDDYEFKSKGRQLGGGHDDSDDELVENKYPPKLVESLREAHRDIKEDNKQLQDEETETNDEVINHWQMYDFKDLAVVNGYIEMKDKGEWDGECICGRTGLRYLYFMRFKNIENWRFHTRIVGSECIRWFCKANPNSSLSFIQRVVKEGCTIIFRKRLTANLIQGTICGSQLPEFLATNRKAHDQEHVMPLTFDKDNDNKDVVNIRMRMTNKGRPRDKGNNHLIKGKRYHVLLDPVIKPKKNEDEKQILDFVVRSIERKKAASSNQVDKEPSVKSFIK